MSDLELKVGVWKYDHALALFDGRAKIEGVDARFETEMNVAQIFENMVRDQAYDVSELGLTFYLRTLEQDNPPFIAIPVFPNRHFRHSAIYVNTKSGIKEPKDLVGKRIGEFATYGHDAGIWPKGILADDYGVTPDQSSWVIGGTDWLMQPYDFIPFIHPDNVEVETVNESQMLGPMLDNGEIDALISAVVPQCVMNGSPNVAQLFPDYQAVERDYYKRTGNFPIMHTVVVKRELVEQNPGLAGKLLAAFSASANAAFQGYQHGRMAHQMGIMSPWFNTLYEENRDLLGDDWWQYGLAANQKNIDTFLRYTYEQGLSKRRLTCEDIFVPELLDT